jgi:hypothetical protein
MAPENYCGTLQKLDASFWFNAWCRRHMRGLFDKLLILSGGQRRD